MQRNDLVVKALKSTFNAAGLANATVTSVLAMAETLDEHNDDSDILDVENVIAETMEQFSSRDRLTIIEHMGMLLHMMCHGLTGDQQTITSAVTRLNEEIQHLTSTQKEQL